jgi:phosphoribosylformimino-5-aminoimidazole carboxamide ribonucleotide (ProFAR) isomerase
MAITATLKKSIKPVTFYLEVTATKVNENGTFSGITVQKVSSSIKNETIRASIPPQAGGAMYLKCDDLKGLEFVEGTLTGATVEKKKLF